MRRWGSEFGAYRLSLIAYRARAPHREGWCGKIGHDEFRLEPEEAIAPAIELVIVARVRGHAASVIAAIDLDDEARAGRVVSDEAEQRDPAPKGDNRTGSRNARQSRASESVGACRIVSCRAGQRRAAQKLLEVTGGRFFIAARLNVDTRRVEASRRASTSVKLAKPAASAHDRKNRKRFPEQTWGRVGLHATSLTLPGGKAWLEFLRSNVARALPEQGPQREPN